jgi:hypothetical protein
MPGILIRIYLRQLNLTHEYPSDYNSIYFQVPLQNAAPKSEGTTFGNSGNEQEGHNQLTELDDCYDSTLNMMINLKMNRTTLRISMRLNLKLRLK